MAIWIILLAMTAAAVATIVRPLSRPSVATPDNTDALFYRDQIAEIERDQGRGLLPSEEAQAAKAEAARRLLRAREAADSRSGPNIGQTDIGTDEPALRRRRAASALALSLVPILAVAVYGAYGSPSLTNASAIQAKGSAIASDLGAAVAQIEAHLAKNPNDGRGWDVLAPVYLRMGRADDAVNAYASALRLLGPDASRLANYGEALVTAKGGIVSSDAKAAFDAALARDPASPKARFYLAQAAAQDGHIAEARSTYEDLLKSAPPDAPWTLFVKQQLDRLDGTAIPVQSEAAMPDAQAIQGMVAGLADRLQTKGGSAEEWARLMRSYMVLGERDKALEATAHARLALAQDAAGLKAVETLAQDLHLTGDAKP